LAGHTVATAYESGWDTLENGNLLQAAEASSFEVLVTTDQNLPHQQSLLRRPIAVVVLGSTSWPKMQLRLAEIALAVGAARPGTVTIVPI
jgi:hypothetical protein